MSFSEGDTMLVSISEELSCAQDLHRGYLLNRRCSDDLRLFLETGRCSSFESNWHELVAEALPWQSAPDSRSLDVTPMADGEEDETIVFWGVVALLLEVFANLAGPQLIGQSSFGPTNFIVERNDLDSQYSSF